MEFEAAMEFFRRCLGDDWEDEAHPVQLSGAEVAELLWPLNEIFRERLGEIERLEYDPRCHAAADSALDEVAASLDLDVLGAAPAGAMRVLLERHKQMICVAMANEAAENPVTTLPSGLSPHEQRIAVMLLLLRSMELPWPVGGPGLPEDR